MAYIQLTLPNGELPFDGKQVTFRAPCDCGAPEGLQIGEQKFLIVDAMGNVITGGTGAFCKDSMLTVILDVTNSYAFLQNPATSNGVTGSINANNVINVNISSDNNLWTLIDSTDNILYNGMYTCNVSVDNILESDMFDVVLYIDKNSNEFDNNIMEQIRFFDECVIDVFIYDNYIQIISTEIPSVDFTITLKGPLVSSSGNSTGMSIGSIEPSTIPTIWFDTSYRI